MCPVHQGDVDNSVALRPRLRQVDGELLVRAAAKLNLSLAVGALRPDGYHAFESLMTTITLSDTLRVCRSDPGIRITCDAPAVPTDSRNLIYRAASLLAWYGRVSPAVAIHLEKHIPMQAGLGGGSADAAAALVGLNELWDLHLNPERLGEVAAVLGSDVKFFLLGPMAICRGRGELVEPLDGWDFWAVVIQPVERLATEQVYRYHRVSDPCCLGLADDLARELPGQRASEAAERFRNDLEAAAFRANQDLGKLREELESLSETPVRLSGSGTAMFAILDSRDQADRLRRRINRSHPHLATWLVRNNPW